MQLFLMCCALGACTSVSKFSEFNQQNHDFNNIYAKNTPDVLTIDQALDLAFKNNMDARIAEQDFVVSMRDVDLQKLNALPTVTAKRSFLKRNNQAASSSISAKTGAQSLEPSISSDRSSRVTMLEANWQLLDAAINIYRSNSTKDKALIAKERYRKVLQNITLDTYSAFYRVAALQQFQDKVKSLLKKSEEEIKVLKTAKADGDMSYDDIDNLQKDIYDKREKLLEVQKQYNLAGLELKALLSIPPDKPIILSFDKNKLDLSKHFSDLKSVNAYVDQALNNRPESREQFLNVRIAQRSVNEEIFKTFPGIGIVAAANNDDNSFLENNSWYDMTATISQSITRMLTMPARYEKSKGEVDLAQSRRRALLAAVVFQVNIAYAELGDAYKNYTEKKRSFDVSTDMKQRQDIMAEAGLVGGLKEFENDAQYTLDQVDLSKNLIDLLSAEAKLEHSIGETPENMSLDAPKETQTALKGEAKSNKI